MVVDIANFINNLQEHADSIQDLPPIDKYSSKSYERLGQVVLGGNLYNRIMEDPLLALKGIAYEHRVRGFNLDDVVQDYQMHQLRAGSTAYKVARTADLCKQMAKCEAQYLSNTPINPLYQEIWKKVVKQIEPWTQSVTASAVDYAKQQREFVKKAQNKEIYSPIKPKSRYKVIAFSVEQTIWDKIKSGVKDFFGFGRKPAYAYARY